MRVTPPFSEALIAWQRVAGRHGLPWQKSRDAYRVWLSEIMLQQTQVATVIPYYERFLARFPDVTTLASAPLDEVIAYWAGLGYYARARNLHRCAQWVATANHGAFPGTASELASLPGIGRSTAAAIAAFAFGQRAAILDGNVKRVLCRQFGIEGFPASANVERSLWNLAESLLPAWGIEPYTQALMDLGALVCTRRQPRCGDCPVASTCVAFRAGRQDELPAARPRPKQPERSAGFVVLSDGERVLLERRPPVGIWGGLLVPPEGEVEAVAARYGLAIISQRDLPPMKHVFTHFRLTLRPVLCRVDFPPLVASPGASLISLVNAVEAGVPAPIRTLLRQVANARD